MEKVCLNGKWIPQNEAVFPISNRAFKYGDSIFESFLIQNKSWVFFADHFQRLTIGSNLLSLQIPANFQEKLKAALNNLPSNFIHGNGRLMLFRNGDGKYTPNDNSCSWLLTCKQNNLEGYPSQEKGIQIDLSDKVVLTPTFLNNHKTGNALPYIIASIEKEEKGVNDLLLLGPARNIVESTNANLFIRQKSQIYTPPLSQGCLAGILRKKFIELIQADSKFELREEPIALNDFTQADEVWLTNTSDGIRWVQRYRSCNFANDQYHYWLNKLNQLIQVK